MTVPPVPSSMVATLMPMPRRLRMRMRVRMRMRMRMLVRALTRMRVEPSPTPYAQVCSCGGSPCGRMRDFRRSSPCARHRSLIRVTLSFAILFCRRRVPPAHRGLESAQVLPLRRRQCERVRPLPWWRRCRRAPPSTLANNSPCKTFDKILELFSRLYSKLGSAGRARNRIDLGPGFGDCVSS